MIETEGRAQEQLRETFQGMTPGELLTEYGRWMELSGCAAGHICGNPEAEMTIEEGAADATTYRRIADVAKAELAERLGRNAESLLDAYGGGRA